MERSSRYATPGRPLARRVGFRERLTASAAAVVGEGFGDASALERMPRHEYAAGNRPAAAGHQPMLIAYDGSLPAQEAVRAAAAVLAGRRAILLTVWASIGRGAAGRLALPDEVVAAGVAALDAEARDTALLVAEEGARFARAGGLDAEPIEAMRGGGVAATITAVADERDASVVVVGSRGRSAVRSTVLGSVTYGVLHGMRRPAS
jgi:nucleotide-binding universal stress UspA family protein